MKMRRVNAANVAWKFLDSSSPENVGQSPFGSTLQGLVGWTRGTPILES